jgi:hypothetical protein
MFGKVGRNSQAGARGCERLLQQFLRRVTAREATQTRIGIEVAPQSVWKGQTYGFTHT